MERLTSHPGCENAGSEIVTQKKMLVDAYWTRQSIENRNVLPKSVSRGQKPPNGVQKHRQPKDSKAGRVDKKRTDVEQDRAIGLPVHKKTTSDIQNKP